MYLNFYIYKNIINNIYINIETPNKYNKLLFGESIIEYNACNGTEGGVLFNNTIIKNINVNVIIC